MLDDVFQEGTDRVLNEIARQPRQPKPQDRPISIWGVVRGLGRSVPAGVAEAGASAVEIMSGLSKVDISPEAMRASQTEEGRKEEQRKARDTLETGFRPNDISAPLRNVAEGYMPDPLTAHGAEMAVAEFGRLGTKAILAGVTLGPIAGAVVAGAEESFTESEKLAQQGVDVGTRTKAGAVTGAITAFGFGLPVAGKTVARTVGLAVAGGPASFMGQQAATRSILENAGYDKLADQYDPFDPAGLALSTLVPLGFGALAMRSASRARGHAPVEPTPVAQAVDEVTVDAARVELLREHVDGTSLAPSGDLQAQAAHGNAMAKAIDQMASGEQVQVADAVTVESRRLVQAWDSVQENPIGAPDDPLVRLMPEDVRSVLVERGPVGLDGDGVSIKVPGYGIVKFIWKHGPESVRPADQQIVRDDLADLPRVMRELEPAVIERNGQEQLTWVVERDGVHVVYGTTRFAQDGEHHLVTMHVDRNKNQPLSQAKKEPLEQFGKEALQASDAGTADRSFVSTEPEMRQGQDSILPRPRDVGQFARLADEARGLMDGRPVAEVIGQLKASGVEVSPEMQNMMIGLSEFSARVPEMLDRMRAAETARPGAPVQDLVADAVEGMRQGGNSKAQPNPLQQRIDALIFEKPNALDEKMPIAFDEQGRATEQVSMREYLDTVTRESQQDAAEAELIQVAANCFLRGL